MRKHNLAFVDIETTGLNVIKHEIIQIGVVITTPKLKVIEKFELKIKPRRIKMLSLYLLKLLIITKKIGKKLFLRRSNADFF